MEWDPKVVLPPILLKVKNKIKASTNSSTAKQVKKILKNTRVELSSVYFYLSIISWEEDNAGSSGF